MAAYVDNYYEVRLAYPDGRVVAPEQFRTVQDAMAVAERHSGVQGGIWFVGDAGDPDQEVIRYNADGSIEVGADVPENDDSID